MKGEKTPGLENFHLVHVGRECCRRALGWSKRSIKGIPLDTLNHETPLSMRLSRNCGQMREFASEYEIYIKNIDIGRFTALSRAFMCPIDYMEKMRRRTDISMSTCLKSCRRTALHTQFRVEEMSTTQNILTTSSQLRIRISTYQVGGRPRQRYGLVRKTWCLRAATITSFWGCSVGVKESPRRKWCNPRVLSRSESGMCKWSGPIQPNDSGIERGESTLSRLKSWFRHFSRFSHKRAVLVQ